MTTSLPLIGVTGSTGQLGGRVAARLAALDRPQRLLVRDPARAPQLPGTQVAQASYEDGRSMRTALGGVQTLFLVSGWGPSRLEHHRSAIDAAVAAGVERIVYTSFLSAAPRATFTHAREHHLTEQHLRASGRRYTFLRPSFYLERAPRWFSEEGIIRGPAGNGRPIAGTAGAANDAGARATELHPAAAVRVAGRKQSARSRVPQSFQGR